MGSPNGEYGWAPDELVPSAVRSGLDQRFSSGWHEKYGPFHYAVLAAAYQPALLARRFGLIRADGPDLDRILAIIGRLVSLLMATGAVWLVARLGRELGDEWAGILGAAFLAFSAPFVYYAKIANLDAPYLFWYALSLLFYVRLLGRHRLRDYVFFAASAAAAVATKDQAYGLYVLTVPAVAAALHARRRAEGDRRLWATLVDARLVTAAAVGLVVLLVLDNVVFNPEGFVAHLRLIAGPASHPFRMFTNDLSGHLALMRLTVRHLAFAMGLPALLVCVAGVAVALARPRANARWLLLLVPPVSYVATFLHVVLYGYDRFVLPLCLVLGLFGGAFLARGMRAAPPLRAAAAALAVAVFAYSLLYAASVDRLLTHDSRYEVERWMARNIPPGALVAAIGPPGYLPRLDGLRWRTPGTVRGAPPPGPSRLRARERGLRRTRRPGHGRARAVRRPLRRPPRLPARAARADAAGLVPHRSRGAGPRRAGPHLLEPRQGEPRNLRLRPRVAMNRRFPPAGI